METVRTPFQQRASLLLGGRGWITKLSIITGVHYTTAHRWSTGELEVPRYVVAILDLLEMVPEDDRPRYVEQMMRRPPINRAAMVPAARAA